MTGTVQNEEQLTTGGGRNEIYISTSHQDSDDCEVTHSYVWWFEPVVQTGPEDARLRVSKFLHKRWTDSCSTTTFTEEYDGEEIIEAVNWVKATEELGLDDVPGCVIDSLMNRFGTDIVRRSVEHDGGTLPEYLYECLDCDGVHEMIPRRTCPECGSDSLVEHGSRETIGENRDILEHLVNAEVTTTLETPNSGEDA